MEPAFYPRERTYAYAPSLIEEEGGKRRYLFYCANREPGSVTDFLCLRIGTRTPSGWQWGEERAILAPGRAKTDWDSRHVCDPEVLAGRFRYQGRTWRYALFYLGCDAENSTHNQVGIAFANHLEGPWRKYPEPIIRYTTHPEGGRIGEAHGFPVYRYWGVGQPAAVSLDGAGKALLCYTRGEETHGQEMVTADLSDMDAGPRLSPPIRVPAAGLTTVGGKPIAYPRNISLAFSPSRKRLYMTREGELHTDTRFPGFISSYVQVAEMAAEDLRAGRGVWRVVATIGRETTGWSRNHNAALGRDARGRLAQEDRLTLALSVADSFETPPPDFAWLWTYRILLYDLPIPSAK
jgi:hypothetical protein